MKKSQKLIFLIFILLLASFFFVGPYLIKNLPFVYGGDLQPEGYPYYTDLQNLVSLKAILKYFRLPFYSWDLFLGTNFWSSKSLNGLSDLFNYVTLWLPVHFYTAFEIQTVMKITVSGITFYFLAKEWDEDYRANLLVSIAYALSSWMIYFIGQPTFASYYAWLPLYFLGIEKVYKTKQPFVFIGAVALLLLTNYYLFYPVIVFSLLYTLYCYYTQHQSLKGYLPMTLWFIPYALIGVFISAVVVYPNILYLLSNDRVGKFNALLVFKNIQVYFHQLVAQLIPSHLIIYQDNPFETKVHNTRELLMWAGSLIALLVPQFLKDKDQAFRKATLVLYISMSLFLIIPIGDSILHGLSEPSFRWVYLWIIMNLFLANRYLAHPEWMDVKLLGKTLLVYLGLLAFVYVGSIAYVHGFKDMVLSYPRTTFAFMVSAVGLSATYASLRLKSSLKWVFIGLILFTELVGAGYINLVQRRLNPSRTWDFENRVSHVLQDHPNELNAFLNNLDPVNASQYYRVYVPQESLYWSYSHNMSTLYQLQGLMTYDSMYAPSFNATKNLTDEVRAFSSDWLFDIKQKDLINFLNTKYAIVLNESDLPKGEFSLITNSYRGGLSIYLNMNYRPLGTLYTSGMDYDTYKSSYHNQLSMLLNTVISKESDLEEIRSYLGDNTDIVWNGINHYDNHLDGSFTTQTNGFMVLSLPYDAGWTLQINGKKVPVFEVNGGFMGIPVEEGTNLLTMDFMPVGFKDGAMMTGLGLGLLGLLIIRAVQRSRT